MDILDPGREIPLSFDPWHRARGRGGSGLSGALPGGERGTICVGFGGPCLGVMGDIARTNGRGGGRGLECGIGGLSSSSVSSDTREMASGEIEWSFGSGR